MSETNNTGYLVQLKSPEGDKIVPIVSTEGLYDENGQKVDLSSMVPDAYTKAETLSSASATKLGLPASTLPADMFNVLAHAGDLHVWRRTVTLSQPGYSLSSEKSDGTLANGDSPGYTNVHLDYGDSITVSLNGDISINNTTSTTVYATGSAINVTNKFIQILDYSGNGSGSPEYANSDFPLGTILFVTGSMVISGSRIYISKYKTVTSYKAGTTIDYPVSTNPNAYTEGTSAGTTIEYLGTLGNKPEVVYGSYTGDNKVSKTINLGKKPKVVVVSQNGTVFKQAEDAFGAIASYGTNAYTTDGQNTLVLSVNGTGFVVYYQGNAQLNRRNVTYNYFALI